MSRIDDLIKRYAPNGVERQALDVSLPTRLAGFWGVEAGTADLNAHAIRNGDIGATGQLRWETLPLRGFTERECARASVRAGDIVMTTSGNCGMVVYIPEDPPELTVATNFVRILRGDPGRLDSRYAFHFLRSSHFTTAMLAFVRGAAMPNLAVNEAFARISMPLPPLEVQSEIARILDGFLELEGELESELEARTTQYRHFRSQLLLEPRETVRELTFGDLGSVRMCKRIFKEETAGVGDVPFFKIGTFGSIPDAYISQATFESYKSRYPFPRAGSVLLSAAGTIGRAVVYDGHPAYFQDSNIVWIDNDETVVTNRYLYHWCSVAEWSTDGGTIKRLYNENLRRTPILAPDLEAQRRTTRVLDSFDALVNDLSSGLPAEIAARRQQYEHYRDRLLTFKEA